MKKIYPIILAAAVAVIALFTSSCGSRSQQPVYDGKPVSECVSDLNYNNPEATRDQAAEAILHIGTNALPFLLKEISDLSELYQKVGTTNFYNSQEATARLSNVHEAFKTLGPIAKPAVPALVDLLNGGYTAFPAAFALTQIDPQAAAIALTQALTNKIIYVRIAAAGELFEVRSNADIALAVPNLVQCLKYEQSSRDSTEEVTALKGISADTLGVIHAQPDIAVLALAEALSNKDYRVRFEAARALSKFGKHAQPAVPILQQIAKDDPNQRFRILATNVLQIIITNSP